MDSSAITDSELLITRHFAAPRDLLFKLWTNPEHITQWWVPFAFKARVIAMEVREGGLFHLELHGPDGEIFPAQGVFKQIIAPELISILGIGEGREDCCGAGLPPRALVTVSFHAKQNGTTLKLHTVFDSATALQAASNMGYNEGWASALDALQSYITNQEK